MVRQVVRARLALIDDASASLAQRSRRVGSLDRTMYLLSAAGDDGRIWFAASALEALRAEPKLGRLAHSLAWLGIESALVNLVIKKVVRRSRPVVTTVHRRGFRLPNDTSFPSGHAASGATMAVLLSHDSPLAPAWVALAAGIGASRVHLGVHHASDVAAGWLVGAGIGLVALKSRSLIEQRTPDGMATGTAVTR